MLDFIRVCVKEPRGKSEIYEVYPDFVVAKSNDLMIQGQAFYAFWDAKIGLWSRNDYDVANAVDEILYKKASELQAQGLQCTVKSMKGYKSGSWKDFRSFLKNVSDNSHPLDSKLTFANTEVKKTDYVSRRLPYSLSDGPIPAYEELVSTLYAPEERQKFEWAIGAIICGDAKKIQKFLVFYGKGGTGKSTIMNIISMIFGGEVKDGGYIETFEAKALVGNNNSFSTEAFRDNPLVAIQQDGDLSKIEDNTKLNSIVSHEAIRINEKYKATYTNQINAFLFMGTNKPVHISDAKSGVIRRLIDVHPTGVTLETEKYFELMARIEFQEIGHIAKHCLDVYKSLGKNAYNGYRPTKMMMNTDVFLNFIEEYYDVFKRQDKVSLTQAWELYKEYAEDAKLSYTMQKHKFREQLKDYFDEFEERDEIDGHLTRSVYKGFNAQQFKAVVPGSEKKKEKTYSLVLEETESLLDEMYSGLPAQYSNNLGNPAKYWDGEERVIRGEKKKPRPNQVCNTVLGELDTKKLHFVKVPMHHIVIDFDLKGEDDEKSLELNREAASGFPPTYAEISKSGAGIHLHYIYDGDVTELASVYSPGIEIKVYSGNSSLRRRLTYCNNVAVATINSGLPFKEKKVQTQKTMQNEQSVRNLIVRCLRKQIPPHASKTSMDFIKHILDEAYESGMSYDVSDMFQDIVVFANKSKKNSEYCLQVASKLKLKSKDASSGEGMNLPDGEGEVKEDRLVYFDCEVYPNLFVICWKYAGDSSVVPMINPTPEQVAQFITTFKLVGYNNRDYDNHILWARRLGASNAELYKLSQRIINEKDNTAKFGTAYNLSYADVYDYIVDKKSLKKWEIDLGLRHMEMNHPWDQPVPDDLILKIVDYCRNDVLALEEVFNHTKSDFIARQLMASLSGLTVMHTTRQHATRIIFNGDREPQKKLIYTDLSEMFPGYVFNEFSKTEKSTFMGEVVGEGGYVYAEPGIYENVALLDIASMHPTSIIALNYLGPFTDNFVRLVEARLAIKHGDFEKARKLLPGIEVNEENAKALSDSLKLVINSIYGFTAATFPNEFRDPRNKDNIVAKRGALFMVLLKYFIEEQGFTVAHIKTDSVKIPDANEHIIKAVQEFGKKYGYTFEHEATYSKMCLVNDAVYVAYASWYADPKKTLGWTATGAQFKDPYVFKTMFSKEPLKFSDLCRTKQVKKGAMHLRFGDVDLNVGGKREDVVLENEETTDDTFVGRSGSFVPVKSGDYRGLQGGELICINGEKESSVNGAKGYRWVESDMIRELMGDAVERLVFEPIEEANEGSGSLQDFIDMAYFGQLAEDAWQAIEKWGDAEEFVK